MSEYKNLTKEALIARCIKYRTPYSPDATKEQLAEIDLRRKLGVCTKTELLAVCAAENIHVPSSANKDTITEAIVAGMLEELASADDASSDASADAAESSMLEAISESISESSEPVEFEPPAATSRKEAARAMREESRQVKKMLKDAVSEPSSRRSEARAAGTDIDLRPRQVQNAPRSFDSSGNSLSVEQAAQQRDDFELLESLHNQSFILTGELISATEPRFVMGKNPKTGEQQRLCVIAAEINYKSRSVFIPAEYFFDDYYEMNPNDVPMFFKNRLFSKVDFRIYDVKQPAKDQFIYLGSRIAAMKYQRIKYWYSENARGRKLIEAGSIHEVRINAVSEKLMFAELLGVETRIFGRDIDHGYVKDVSAMYYPGDTELVKVMSVTLSDRDRALALDYPVQCELSVKETKPNPMENFFTIDRTNTPFAGIVYNIDFGADNTVNYYVRFKDWTIMCRLGKTIAMQPEEGQRVEGTITYCNKDELKAYGVITHVVPKKSF